MRIDIPFSFLEAGDNVSLYDAINNQLAVDKKEKRRFRPYFPEYKKPRDLRGAVIAA